MTERLKVHVLKTCLGHTNVGSNPTPSARVLRVTVLATAHKRLDKVATTKNGEVPEWLNGLAC